MPRVRSILTPFVVVFLMLVLPQHTLAAQRANPQAIRNAALDHLDSYLSVFNFMSSQVKLTPINMDRIASEIRLTPEERLARAMVNIYDQTPADSPQFANIVKSAMALDAVVCRKYVEDPAFLQNMLGAALEGYEAFRAAGDREEVALNAKMTPQLAARVSAMAKVFVSYTADSVTAWRAKRRAAIDALIEQRPELIHAMLQYQPSREVQESRNRVVALIGAAR